jgi:hypothetical protein
MTDTSKHIGTIKCAQYKTKAEFFIRKRDDAEERELVVRYDNYVQGVGQEHYPPYLPIVDGKAEFVACIPADWIELDVLRFIDMDTRKGLYPIWEMPARVYGDGELSWPAQWPRPRQMSSAPEVQP